MHWSNNVKIYLHKVQCNEMQCNAMRCDALHCILSLSLTVPDQQKLTEKSALVAQLFEVALAKGVLVDGGVSDQLSISP